jgi:hypothetical protein
MEYDSQTYMERRHKRMSQPCHTTPVSKSCDMQRHLHAFVHLTLDHWAHDTRRYTDDLRFVCRDTELEVLNQVSGDGLHLDHAVKTW